MGFVAASAISIETASSKTSSKTAMRLLSIAN